MKSLIIHQVLKDTENQFIRAKLETPRLDAEVLLAHLLKCTRAYLYTWPNSEISSENYDQYQQMIVRRLKGEPIAYIIGQKDFWTLTLKVSKDVLIPRPETELLVETVLKYFPSSSSTSSLTSSTSSLTSSTSSLTSSTSSLTSSTSSFPPPPSFPRRRESIRILELGTGSGAIALSIAKEKPDWHITATDKSQKALSIAKENAKSLSIQNVEFRHSDWFLWIPAGVYPERSRGARMTEVKNNHQEDKNNYQDDSNNNPEEKFHVIISNPPYIAENDPHLSGSISFEPKEALVSGVDGLQDLKHIIQNAPNFLFSNGLLILEHGFDQDADVRHLMERAGFQDIETLSDINKVSRATLGRKP